MMKNILAISLILLCFVVFLAPLGLAVEGPTAQLKPTLKSLTDVLADEGLKGDAHRAERRTRIKEVIKAVFDFREMSRRILGRTWNEIQAEEQKQFTDEMIKLLENIYIGKLEGYSGQQIEYIEERIKDNRALVSTTVTDNGVKVPVNYILNLVGEKWMVYDINIEGVSLVGNYREQFKSILRKDKFAGLLKVLEEKNRSFETVTTK
jgi:phospholipid transport system substrate-binding protein